MSMVVVHVCTSHLLCSRLLAGTERVRDSDPMAGPLIFTVDCDVTSTRLPVLLHHLAAMVMDVRLVLHVPSFAVFCWRIKLQSVPLPSFAIHDV